MPQRIANAAARPVWVWPLLATVLATKLVRVARDRATVGAAAAGASADSRTGGNSQRVEKRNTKERRGFLTKVLEEIPYGTVFRDAALQWVSHNAGTLGAALAYYSVFSIGPLIVIAIAMAGLFFGATAVRAQVLDSLQGLLGQGGAQAIDGMLSAANKPREGVVAIVISTGTLVFAAIGVVIQLKSALNTVWDAKPAKGNGLWRFIRTYLLSFAGVISVGFLLLVSMLMTAALAAFGKMAGPYFPEALAQFGGSLISFLIIALLFAAMFKWLPDTPVGWRDVWSGALLTAALFELGKFLIALYIGQQGLESTYGAAASIVVLLIWVYYSAQILLFGAEFTNVIAKRHSARREVVPLSETGG